jgi:peptidoglycan/xylan/chitin deacetylase (PgdA/CDA1 family)
MRLAGHAPGPVILLYHRIADADADPWGLAVTPENFDRHLELLARTRTVLPLTDFANLRARGRLPRDAAAVTFDDGYACNALTALPLLRRHGVPATIFLTTGKVGDAAEFWSDALERIVTETAAPTLALWLAGERLVLELGDRDTEDDLRTWRADGGPPATARQAAYHELWRRLRNAPSEARDEAILSLHAHSGVPATARPTHRPVTTEEVRLLAADPLIEIGAHSLTHPTLSQIALSQRRDEVIGSREACAELTGREPESFAYPYGDYDAQTVEIVGQAGFSVACTTQGGCVSDRSDPLQLPRTAVLDWSADGLRAHLAAQTL